MYRTEIPFRMLKSLILSPFKYFCFIFHSFSWLIRPIFFGKNHRETIQSQYLMVTLACMIGMFQNLRENCPGMTFNWYRKIKAFCCEACLVWWPISECFNNFFNGRLKPLHVIYLQVQLIWSFVAASKVAWNMNFTQITGIYFQSQLSLMARRETFIWMPKAKVICCIGSAVSVKSVASSMRTKVSTLLKLLEVIEHGDVQYNSLSKASLLMGKKLLFLLFLLQWKASSRS